MAVTRYPDLDLDLSFRPIPSVGTSFTTEMAEHYNERGFTQPTTVFTEDAVRRMHRQFVETDPGTTIPLNPHTRVPWVFDIVANAGMLSYGSPRRDANEITRGQPASLHDRARVQRLSRH